MYLSNLYPAAVDSINTTEESNIDAEPAMVENQVLVSGK